MGVCGCVLVCVCLCVCVFVCGALERDILSAGHTEKEWVGEKERVCTWANTWVRKSEQDRERVRESMSERAGRECWREREARGRGSDRRV